MDINNPVVQLCADGMRAEAEGQFAEARALFLQAWESRTDDYDACIAAHYVARHQESPADTLHWNQTALDHADAVGDERVKGFYASLYLNLGHSHETLGNVEEAKRYYDLATSGLDDAPEGSYASMVRRGVEEAHRRLGLQQ